MNKGTARKLIPFLLALTMLFAAACGGGGETNVDIAPNDKTNSPLLPGESPAGTDAQSPELTPDSGAPATTPPSSINADELDGTAEVKEEAKLTYAEYRAINSDVIGWIKIGNTNIDYPLVKGPDNEYYLTRNVRKADSAAGAIYMDYRCSPGDGHAIIHGHNMSKSKIMFAQLSNYGNKSFYEANRTFKMTFDEREYTYKIYSVFSVDVNDSDYMKVDANFADEASLATFLNDLAVNKSIYAVDTTIEAGDHVLTLSTCTHTNYKNGRYVIQAVRVD